MLLVPGGKKTELVVASGFDRLNSDRVLSDGFQLVSGEDKAVSQPPALRDLSFRPPPPKGYPGDTQRRKYFTDREIRYVIHPQRHCVPVSHA